MILSPKHKFLLIKNYKVGGTSLEVELSQIIKDSDAIFTKIDPPNQYHKIQNDSGFYNHMSYLEIANKLGFDYINSLSSVVFVRNPFDVVLSHLYMAARWSGISDVTDQVVTDYFNGKLKLDRMLGIKTRRLYTIDNIVSVNNVLKYEDGLESINKILSDVGIDNIKNIYKEKQYKPFDIKFNDIFTNSQLDIIRNDWSWEFESFGYNPYPSV